MSGAFPTIDGQAQNPVFRAGVDLITIETTVLNRDGAPILSLEPGAFVVRVDGRPRRLVWARLIQTDDARANTRDATSRAGSSQDPAFPPTGFAAGNARLFAFVVDRETIPNGEGQQMLEAAARFIDGLPTPDRVGVWVLPTPTSSLEFTSDRERAKRALQKAVGTYRPPLCGFEAARDVEKCDDLIAADWRERAHVTLRNLEPLVEALASIDHPKQLVLLTGGPVATDDDLLLIAGVGAQAAAARVTIHALQVRRTPYQARADRMDAAAPVQKLLDQIPETPDSLDQVESAAYRLAGATGGLAITPLTGTVAFAQLKKQLSARYILAIDTEPSDRDGQNHRIEVSVHDLGFGASIRHRSSFRLNPTPRPPVETTVPPQALESLDRSTVAGTPRPVNPSPPAVAVGTDEEELKGRLAAYVERFEREFAAVVGEERCVQMIHPWRGNPKSPDQEPSLEWRTASESSQRKGGPVISRRQLVSDILLVQIAGRQWIGYRDVAEVDGAPVRDRTERVRELFLSGAPDAAAQFRRIADESARYNLGDFRRTLNVPTVTLSFMRRNLQSRFGFTRANDENVGGRASRVLRFKERSRPTLVSTANGVDVPIEGRIWMDAENGRVLRTELRFDRGQDITERRAQADSLTGKINYVTDPIQNGEQRASIQVEFGPLPELPVLVPVQMWEWYEGANQLGRLGADKTALQSLSTYSRFRRFQVTTTEQVIRRTP